MAMTGLDSGLVAAHCGRIRTGIWNVSAPATGTQRQFAEKESSSRVSRFPHACVSIHAASPRGL